MLSLKEIRELIDLVAERGLAGLEIERAGFRLRIDGPRPSALEPAAAHAPARPASSPDSRIAPSAAEPRGRAPARTRTSTSSPRPSSARSTGRPSPESEPFAEVGERIAKGKILCIIESMKLMNEIESDVEGEVVAVYAENGQPVEYGEKLFAIRLAA